jgi:hypothetical protein
VDLRATKRTHTWRLHTLLASIQTKHLDEIRRYLFGVRKLYERVGPSVRHVRKNGRRNLNPSLANVARPHTSAAIPQEGLTQTLDEVQVEIGTSMTELLRQAMEVASGSQELVYDGITRTGNGNAPSQA